MDLDPIPQVWVDNPHPVYCELRARHPVYHVAERDLWVVSRYQDVQAVLRSPERFSSASGVVPSGYAPESPTIITTDPPEHTAIRKSVARAFTPKRMAALEPVVRRLARALVAELPETGEFDAFAQFSDLLPYQVMAELLGLEPETFGDLKRCGDVIVYSSGVEASEMETDCATSTTQPVSQICDEFKTLRVQSADPFQLDSGFQTICSEDTATLALDAIHTLPGNRLSEHPIVGPPQDLLLKISVLRI